MCDVFPPAESEELKRVGARAQGKEREASILAQEMETEFVSYKHAAVEATQISSAASLLLQNEVCVCVCVRACARACTRAREHARARALRAREIVCDFGSDAALVLVS